MRLIKTISLLFVSVMMFSACNNITPSSTENLNTQKSTSESTAKKVNSSGKVDAINDAKFANSTMFCTTEKYIYRCFGDLTRYNKTTYSSSTIYDHVANIVAVTNDCLYYIECGETSSRLCRIYDNKESPEYLYDIKDDSKLFIDGKYIYNVTSNGSIIRHINSEKDYYDTEEVIYTGTASSITNAALYNNCINYVDTNKKQLVKISLDNGSAETLTLQGVTDSIGAGSQSGKVYYENNSIIYTTLNNQSYQYDLYAIDLGNGTTKKFENLDVDHYFTANGCIYASVDEWHANAKFYKIDLATNNMSEINGNAVTLRDIFSSKPVDIGKGLIYTTNSSVYHVSDYNFNTIGDFR